MERLVDYFGRQAREMSDEQFVALQAGRAGTEVIYARSRRTFDRHTHDAYAFGIIEDGGQHWRSGRGQVDGYAGDLIMSNPGEVHDGSPIGDGARTWRMLHIQPDLLASVLTQLEMARPFDYEFERPVVRDPRLFSLMRQLTVAVQAPTMGLRFDELLVVLIRSLGRSAPARESDRFSRIRRARDRLDQDPAGTHLPGGSGGGVRHQPLAADPLLHQ